MGKILIGTASWADPGFIRDWYPGGIAAADRLRWYADHFQLVELNSSYYGVPRQAQVRQWCRQTPSDFVFDVKLHKLLSRHATRLIELTPELRRVAKTNGERVILTPELDEAAAKNFAEQIAPFADARKLGALLLQLSPAFSPYKNQLAELEPMLAVFGVPVALELRHRDWMNDANRDKTIAFFRGKQLTFVNVDAPASEHFTVMPSTEIVTDRHLAYVRLHGRNETAYVRGRTVADRFDYDYSAAEIDELGERAKRLAKEAEELHVIFNNNRSNYAPKAAAALVKLLAANRANADDSR